MYFIVSTIKRLPTLSVSYLKIFVGSNNNVFFCRLSLVSWTDITCNNVQLTVSRTRIIVYMWHIACSSSTHIKKESSLNARQFILKFVTERNVPHRSAGKSAQSRNVSKDSLLLHNIHKDIVYRISCNIMPLCLCR